MLLAHESGSLTRLPSVFRTNVAGDSTQPSPDDFSTFWESLFYERREALARVLCALGSEETIECKLTLAGLGGGIHMLQHRFPTKGDAPAGSRDGTGQVPPPQDQRFTFQVRPEDQGCVSGSGLPGPSTRFVVVSTRLEHPAQDAELYNQVSLLEGGEERLLALLREIDPRLQKLRYAKAPGTSQPLVYAHFGMKNALSMTQTGQGFSKLFSLFCQMLVAKPEVLLIDEMENGLYYETLPEIWRGIATLAASENIQVFATTHSRECIQAAHEAFQTMPRYEFALHRLQRVQGRIDLLHCQCLPLLGAIRREPIANSSPALQRVTLTQY